MKTYIYCKMLTSLRRQISKMYVKRHPEVSTKPITIERKRELTRIFLESEYKHDAIEHTLNKVDEITTLKLNEVTLNVLGKPPSLILCKKVIARVATLVHIFSGESIEMWWLPCDIPRYLPLKNEVISPDHINGGFAFPRQRTIYIFRKDEFPKVALHEAFHTIPLIHTDRWNSADLLEMYKQLHMDMRYCTVECMECCNTKLEPNEAIVETWAILFQILFICYELNVDLPTLHKMIDTEIQLGYHNSSLLVDRGALDPTQEWKEDTHLFSYIILKTVLLSHLNEFLTLKRPYNPTEVTHFLLKYIKSPNFLINLHKNKGIFESMNSFRFGWFSDL